MPTGAEVAIVAAEQAEQQALADLSEAEQDFTLGEITEGDYRRAWLAYRAAQEATQRARGAIHQAEVGLVEWETPGRRQQEPAPDFFDPARRIARVP